MLVASSEKSHVPNEPKQTREKCSCNVSLCHRVEMSADSSESDRDVFLTDQNISGSTVDKSSRTFQVVLKGGAPWGFTLQGGVGTQSPVQIQQVDPEGKSHGHLKADDYILAVNGMAPESLCEGEQLIKDAFRTLTLTVWRGTSKLESGVKILRSSSFLHRSREGQERDRERRRSRDQDENNMAENQRSSAERVMPRQRRADSFHGRTKNKHSSSHAAGTTPNQDPSVTFRNHLSSSSISLSSSHPSSPRDPPSNKNRHSFGSTPPATSQSHSITPGRRSLPAHSSIPPSFRNTEILPNKQRHSSGNSNSSTGSGHRASSRGTQNEESSRRSMSMKGWNTIQDLTQKQQNSSRVDPPNGSHVESSGANPRLGHLSPATSSPSLHMANPQQKKPPSPRLDLYKPSSDINSYPQPLSPRSPTNASFSFSKGFKKMAWSHNADFSSGYQGDKMKDVRQSLPSNNKPFKSDLHDYQNINEVSSSQTEVDATDLELQKLTQRPPREPYDPRPACSPPAPPVRDVSSLQYVNKPQSHEKYPSWPVTQPNLETEPGEPINSPKLKQAFHPQLGPVNERNSPNSERKGGDDYKRNASDPGFKKQTSLTRFMKRPTPSDHEKRTINLESKKSAESQMEQFFSSSPGYPNPMMDQDGNRIGDEKYNIPSPPERESRAPDEKTLSEKIASIVGPHHDSWHGSSGYHSDYKSRDSSSFSDSPNQDYKKRDSFTREGPEKSPVVRGLVDTGTNPQGSDGKSVSSSSLRFEPPRTYVVKQMVCYNTGTQTEDKSSPEVSSSDKYFQEKSIQARLSSSDSDHFKQPDSQRRDVYSGNLGESKETKRKENFPEEYSSNMAPMLRKLTKEYYGGKLGGSEKRLSSASSQDSSIRSPGSDMPSFIQYPGMKEAESYSSVVIHPHENSMPFGRDYAESKSSISDSRHDVSGFESERGSVSELRSKQMRHGLDPSLYSPKYPLYQTGSRSDLNRDQNRLLTGHDKHSKSISNIEEYNRGVHNSDSSPSMPNSSNSDSRSSTSTRYSSESSVPFQNYSKPRHESTDSVFTDPSSPLTPGGAEGPRRPNDLGSGRQMGRSASMKKAYGVYEEHLHKRHDSDSLSSSNLSSSSIVHTRSLSTEYVRMDHYQKMHAENKHMALIREDSLENRSQDQRWEDMVRKSKRSQADKSMNYENIQLGNMGNGNHSAKVFLPVSNLKRTSSEQIRPMKDRFNERQSARKQEEENSAVKSSEDPRNRFKSPNQSLMDLSSKDPSDSSFDHRPRSTSDSVPKEGSNFSSSVRHVSDPDKVSPDNPDISSSQIQNDFNKDSNLKDVQRTAVQKFMDRVTGKKTDEETESTADTTTTLTPSESFRLKYGSRAERQESLRRSRSISSRDSDYMEMRRPERQQTEWSRIRSQTGGSRPHSIGSDSSLVDPYAITTLPSFPDSEPHQRSQSDSTGSVSQTNTDELRSVPVKDHAGENNDQSSGGISKNSLYQNVGYRPPPPPPQGGDEDKPPALPPRNYRRFSASQSDSSLPHRPLIPQPLNKERPSLGYEGHSSESRGRWDDDNYAEQLRKQSRRLSEQQHMPQPMTYKTTKTSIQFTQSYKQQHVEALEATSPNGSTSSSEQFFSSRRLSAGQPPSPNSAPSVPPLPSSKYMPSPSSPQISPKGESLSRPQQYPEPKSYHSPESKADKPRLDIPPVTQGWQSRPSPSSPDPPPPPTPQKELSADVDLPPPPPELIENSPEHKDDRNRYAEDSYGSYKNRTDRQPGVYKRSASSGDALKLLHENNNYKQQGDIQKPLRKRLQPGWKSEQTVNQEDQLQEQAETSQKDPVRSDRPPPPRPLLSSQSASHLLAPKPYAAPESSKSNSFSVSSMVEQDSVITAPIAERQSVQDRISSIERKQSLSRERPEVRQTTPQGGQYFGKKSYENFSKSFTATPSRRTYETDKFSASLSETSSGQKPSSKFQDPTTTPNRRTYSPEQIASNDRSNESPPPVDRSPGSGYPGGRNIRNNESNGQSAFDSNSKMSFSDSKRQSPSKPISTNSSSPSEKNNVSDLVQHSRQRSQEELECDAKVQEFAKIYEKKDPKLSSMLKSDGGRMQYMDGLFHTEIDQDILVRRSPKTSPKSSSVANDQEALQSVTPNKEGVPDEAEKSPLPSNYWVSPSKALIEMNIRQSEGIGKDMTKDIDDSDKLIKTKEELVDSIQKKMDKLKEEKKELTKELEETETLGKEVQKAVERKCKKQHDKDKFKTYIGDMEKIILLLLKVSGLLARAENALQSLPEDSNERLKKMAADKRDRAKQQHEDAKVLKEDIEKRSAQIEVFLQEALSEEEFADYKYYVKMKSKLTIEKQELEDKISLGEEQISALKLSIPEKH